MTLHIVQPEFACFVRLAEGDSLVQLEPGEALFSGVRLLASYDNQPIAVYSAWLCDEVEAFTGLFCQHHEQLARYEWVACLAHGRQGFQEWSVLGSLKFLREHQARVRAVLAPEQGGLLTYYERFFGQSNIEVRVLEPADGQPAPAPIHPPAPQPKMRPSLAEMPDVQPAEVAEVCLRCPQFEAHGGALVENARGKPYWYPWEAGAPFSHVQASFGGLPFYSNPNIFLALAALVEHLRPSLIVEIEPYKFGLTSALAMLAKAVDCQRVTAVVPEERRDDRAWFDALRARPWAGNVVRVTCDLREPWTDQLAVACGFGERAPMGLALINVHARPLLENSWALVKRAMSRGVVVFHGDNHHDTPGFIGQLQRERGVMPVRWCYAPEGGTWVGNGCFWFEQQPV